MIYFYKYYINYLKRNNSTFLLNYTVLSILLNYLFYKFYDYFNKGVWLQNLAIFVMLLFLIYWFFSVFLFLINKNNLNRYTSVIQRFWKRSLHLFWIIEIFLFLIYLFLVSITPEENFYTLDSNRLNRRYILDLYEFFNKMSYIIIFIFYINFYLFFFRFSSKQSLFILFILFLNYLLLEFIQMYYLLNFVYDFFYKYDENDYFWSYEWEGLKTRTQNHFVVLLSILKFWHTFYIYIYLYIYIWYKFNKNNSYNWISTLLQNFFYIFLFNIIFMYVWLKYTIKYFSIMHYYWFFSNTNIIFNLQKYFNWYYYYL